MMKDRVYPHGTFRVLRVPSYPHAKSDLKGGATLGLIKSVAFAHAVIGAEIPADIVEAEHHNLITDAGRERMAQRFRDRGDPPSHIAVGTDSTAPDGSDEALGSEIYRAPFSNTATLGEGEEGTVIFRAFVPENQGNDVTIREGGLLDAASEGTLLARSVLDEAEWISKSSAGDDIFILEWEIAYSNITT